MDLSNLDRFFEDESVGNEVEGGFELNPTSTEDGGYVVEKGGVPVCDVEFINKESEKSEDLELAQDSPEMFIAVITNISNEALTDEYISKLTAMGFEDIQK